MWQGYVITCDPRQGGIHIAASFGLEQEVLDKISNNCLELIAKDYNQPCISICPLSSKRYAFSMAKKIPGNRKEPRTHEIIRGIVLDKDELYDFCNGMLNNMYDFFFPEDTDFENPENWKIPITKNDIFNEKKNIINQLPGGFAIFLCNALKKVQKKRMKIQLSLENEDGDPFSTFICLVCMQKFANTKLFIVVDGECTIESPDILILDRPCYQNMRGYRKMKFSEFIEMGKKENEEDTPINSEEQKIKGLVAFCLDYIKNEKISDYDLYEAVDVFSEKEQPCLFHEFLLKLREELSKLSFGDIKFNFEIRRYMELLYMTYKEPRKIKTNRLEMAPYNYKEICQFLKKKSRNRKELEKLINHMVNVQLEEIEKNFNLSFSIKFSIRNRKI